MVRLFGRPRLRRAVVGKGEAADASDARAIYLPDIPDYVHQIEHRHRLGGPTRWPGFGATFELAFYGPKDLNTVGTIRSDRYQRGTFQVGYSQSRTAPGWVASSIWVEHTASPSICSARAWEFVPIPPSVRRVV